MRPLRLDTSSIRKADGGRAVSILIEVYNILMTVEHAVHSFLKNSFGLHHPAPYTGSVGMALL